MPRPARAALSFAAFLSSTPALAHGAETESGWSVEPFALALVLASATTYSLGYRAMSPAQRRAIAPSWRICAYGTALVVLVAALFSPIDARADDSFAWHMAQHLLLMLGAGPLLALANTHLVALMALPLPSRRSVGRTVSRTPGVRQGASDRQAPMVAGLVFALGLWLWHAPRLYDAALENPALHTLEHLTFVITSAVFWRMVSTAGNRRLDALSAVVLVTLIGLQGNLLAALITLAPHTLYTNYAGNPLADQQVAGLLMWMPAGLVYLVATARALHVAIGPHKH